MAHMENTGIMKIFVFSSNLAGKHNKAQAQIALKEFGAVYGQGEGLQGKSYAVATCDQNFDPLPIVRIQEAINRFMQFARKHPEMHFDISPIGCDIAGYAPAEIASFFAGRPPNCRLPAEFELISNAVTKAREPEKRMSLAERLSLRAKAPIRSVPQQNQAREKQRG
jgi:hypothetical protein